MSYEDYIDAYYESAMTAEKLYDRLIEVTLELQKWIDEIDNVVVKEYREALSWGIYSNNKKIQKRFNEWKNEIESKVKSFIQSSELYMTEDTFQWVILPFDTSLLPYKYNGKFGALVTCLVTVRTYQIFTNMMSNLIWITMKCVKYSIVELRIVNDF